MENSNVKYPCWPQLQQGVFSLAHLNNRQ